MLTEIKTNGKFQKILFAPECITSVPISAPLESVLFKTGATWPWSSDEGNLLNEKLKHIASPDSNGDIIF